MNGPLRDVIDCHCHRCRRWTGHHVAATESLAAHIHVEDDATLCWYSPDATVEYGFCNACGSSLFWRVIGALTWSIGAGTLNTPTGLRTTSAWWLSEASDYLDPSVGVADRHQTE